LSSQLFAVVQAHIICLTHLLEGMVFRQDVIISTETTFFQVLVD
jgi:hypothetical protein